MDSGKIVKVFLMKKPPKEVYNYFYQELIGPGGV
jgi:hypothetical protein